MKQFAPRWAEKIENRTFKQLKKPCKIRGKHLNIGQYDCCIVGETHNFNQLFNKINFSCYDCKECEYYSNSLCEYIEENPNETIFKKLLDEFIDHVKQEHPDLIKPTIP